MQRDLSVNKSSRRPAERPEPFHDQLEKQRRHCRAFGVMQPVAVAPIVPRIRRRRQLIAVACDKIIDDSPSLRQPQRSVLDDRRLPERMDVAQAPWRKHGFRVALIADDFVIERKLFQEPQDSLRPRVVEMVDFDQMRPTLAAATRQRSAIGSRRAIWTPSAARTTHPKVTLR